MKKLIRWALGVLFGNGVKVDDSLIDRLDAIKIVIEDAEGEEKRKVAEEKFKVAFKQYRQLERMIDRTNGFNKLSFIQNCRKRIEDNNYNRFIRGEKVRDLKMTA